jgi:RNA polymerase sigma-70 factor, ECF subfamily
VGTRDDTQHTVAKVTAEPVDPAQLDIGVLARQHYDAVFRFCARRVGQDHAADAAQETFLTAQRALRNFRGESSVSTWLFGIANNECRRLLRKGRSAPVQLLLDLAEDASVESEQSLVDREALSQAMLKLSQEHREVVILHELDGLTYEEAAVVLGIPVGTVKSRLHHAFLNLRRLMGVGG